MTQIFLDLSENTLDPSRPGRVVGGQVHVEQPSARLAADRFEPFPVVSPFQPPLDVELSTAGPRGRSVQFDEVDRKTKALCEVGGLRRGGSTVPVDAVRNHDQRAATGFSTVLEQGEQDPVVQRRSQSGHERSHAGAEQWLVACQRLGQTHLAGEIDDESPIARRQGRVDEAGGHLSHLAPDGQHAV